MSRRSVRRAAAVAGALLAGAASTGEARAADGSTTTTGLGIKLPPIEVKLAPVEVKVPSVEVKLSPVQVQVPSVEVKLPPVDVKLPPVEATVPPLDVKVPQVEAPTPSQSQDAPAPTAPRAPAGGGDSQTSPAKGADAPARETSQGSGAGSASSGDAPSRGGAARGGSATRREGTPTRVPMRAEGRGGRAVPPAIRRRERRLRQVVRSLRGCLGALPSIETRVLTLRAGGGERPPLSRRQVARRLDVGVRRVAAVERRGLDRLRDYAGDDGCGGQRAPAVSTVAAAPADAGAPAGPTPPATSPQPAHEARDRAGVVEAVTSSLGGTTDPELTPSVLLVKVTSPPVLLLLIGGFLVGFAINWRRDARVGARRPAAS